MWHLLHKNTLSIQKLCFQTKDVLRAHKFSFTRDSTYLVFQVCQQFCATDSRLKLKREVADTLKWQSNPSEHFCGKTPGQSPSERSQNFLFYLRFLSLHSLSLWSCWHGHHMSTMCCCTVLRWQHCFYKTSSWKNSPFYHPCPSPDFPRIILMIVDLYKPPQMRERTFLKSLASFLLKPKTPKSTSYLCIVHQAIIHSIKRGSVIKILKQRGSINQKCQ